MKTKIILSSLVMGLVSFSQAAIVLVENANISIPTSYSGVYLDIETGSNAAAPFGGADINFFFGGEGISNDADTTVGTPSLQFERAAATMLAVGLNARIGQSVGPSTTFASGFGASGSPNDHLGTSPGQFEDGVRGKLAFSLITTGPTTVYGYLDVTLTNNTSGGIIHGWAYEDTGANITVIPEPTSSLMAMLGSMAFLFGRRRAKSHS
jgi:hypothetical protein